LPKFSLIKTGLGAADPDTKQLSRLAASAGEIAGCARTWKWSSSPPVLLEGADATKQKLVAALRRQPAVVHVAAHVLFPQGAAGPGLIGMSLGQTGEVDYLSSTEVANLREHLGLVVLNGCTSGAGRILPGAGLLGMTRAWLAAGAGAVIASRWPTPDDTGELFQTLYSSLEPQTFRGSYARALRNAQLAQLREGGWRARPGYWAAYFCLERN
jgi:CHAT domain-containing protein